MTQTSNIKTADALRTKFRRANPDDESSRSDTDWEENTDEKGWGDDTVRRKLFGGFGKGARRIIPKDLVN